MSKAAETYTDLPDEIDELKKLAYAQKEKLSAQRNEIAEWKQTHEKTLQEYNELKEKYRILRHTLFGRSSEKWTADEQKQALLFNEPESYSEEPEGIQTERITYDRVKARGKRKKIPADIHREEVVHDLSEEEKVCNCGAKLTRIGEEVSEKLEIIPAQVKVLEIKIKGVYNNEGFKS
jgi:uncharacterized protein (DUF3084 family)